MLIILLLVPIVGALLMYPLRHNVPAAKATAMVTAVVEFVLVVVIWVGYSPAAASGGTRFQYEFSVPWIPAFGTHLAFGIDGIALVLLALTAFLVPGLMLFAWAEKLPVGRTASGYFALLLATEATLVGVFTATDVFLFYVFFEAMLIPMYFLIGRFGGPNRQYASVKFFLYSLLGGLIMLASLIGLYVTSGNILGHGTFTWAELQAIAHQVPTSTQIWLFLGFFIAFAIKAPLVPFHTWLPDAGAEAPIVAAVLLVGVLDKVGTFGFLRYTLPLFPEASKALAPLVITLAVIGVLYGALLAVGQKDMSRFVAYTSIAHFGFIALGTFAFSSQAFAGATLVVRGGSRLIGDYGGVSALTPVLAGCLLLAGMSSLALPGTNSFVSEFLVLVGSFPNEPVATIIATVGIIFAALYILWFYQQTMQGPLRGQAVLRSLEPVGGPGAMIDPAVAAKRGGGFPDLTKREIGVLAPLIVVIVVLGFFPKPVLDVVNPSVQSTMTEIGLPDPVPAGGVSK
jgi:NADH-quinone oxidoreductase subunit M